MQQHSLSGKNFIGREFSLRFFTLVCSHIFEEIPINTEVLIRRNKIKDIQDLF
jgi:hypothetical protein